MLRSARFGASVCLVRECSHQVGGGSMRLQRALVRVGLLAVALLAFMPTGAHAQSGIAGVVKDATGAVLPGVTVEAASDVLIEKVRTVSTDANGAYRIEN